MILGIQRQPKLFPSALSPTNPQHRLSYEKTILFMSHPTAHPTTSSSNFQLIINSALEKYKKRTKFDLLAHPLAAQLRSCNSPSDILAVLQQQVQGLDQSQSTDERWTRWLGTTVNVIYALSSTLAAGVSLVCLRKRTFCDMYSDIRLAGILTRECDIYWSRCGPFSAYPSFLIVSRETL